MLLREAWHANFRILLLISKVPFLSCSGMLPRLLSLFIKLHASRHRCSHSCSRERCSSSPSRHRHSSCSGSHRKANSDGRKAAQNIFSKPLVCGLVFDFRFPSLHLGTEAATDVRIRVRGSAVRVRRADTDTRAAQVRTEKQTATGYAGCRYGLPDI